MLTFELLFAAALGTLAGALVGLVAGLVPGLHTNNLAQGLQAQRGLFLAAMAAAVGAAAPFGLETPKAFAGCGFLFGLVLGHAFTDEIPAVFLGAPDPETALSVLPGHRLLMAGMGTAAVRAAALGSLLGILMSLPLVPLLAAAMGPPLHLYAAAATALPFLLIAVAGALVSSERGSADGSGLTRTQARVLAGALLLLSAGLGELVMFRGLALPTVRPLGTEPAASTGYMLALFAGLFGLPTLLMSAWSAPPPTLVAPRDQVERRLALPRRKIAACAALGTLSGALVGWLPGVGAAQAAALSKLTRDRLRRHGAPSQDPESRSPQDAAEFLVTQSAVAAANLLFNLVALFALLRVRSGTMAAVQEVGEGAVTRWDDFAAPPALLVALLLSGVLLLPLCYAGALMLGSVCSRFYTRLPPRPLSAAVFVFLVALIAALEGTVGLAVAGCALALGLVPPVAGVKRVHLMGAVLIPVALRLLLGG